MTWFSIAPALAVLALLFTNGAQKFTTPAVTNLFGTPERVAFGMGPTAWLRCATFGELLGASEGSQAPKGLRIPASCEMARTLWDMKPAVVPGRLPGAGDRGPEVDLGRLPVQHCWPGDVAPLITLGPRG